MARSVLDLLLEIQLIDDRQHEDVLSRATSAAGGHLIQTTCELGYATESSLARALSAELGLQRAELASAEPEPGALELLDAKICRDRFVLPLSLHEGGALLWVAMADPTDKDTVGLLSRKTQKRIRPLVAGPTELLRAVARLYPGGKPGTGPIAGGKPGTGPIAAGKPGTGPIAAGKPGTGPIAGAKPGTGPIAGGKPGTGPVSPAAGAKAPARPPAGPDEAPDEASSPLARIAAALGVRVPQRRPSAGSADRPHAAPAATAGRAAAAGGLVDDLSAEDLETLEALRASLDKGALVLRAITELCVEKGLLTEAEAGEKPRP